MKRPSRSADAEPSTEPSTPSAETTAAPELVEVGTLLAGVPSFEAAVFRSYWGLPSNVQLTQADFESRLNQALNAPAGGITPGEAARLALYQSRGGKA